MLLELRSVVIQICVMGTFNSSVAPELADTERVAPSWVLTGAIMICLEALNLKQYKPVSNLT